MKNTTLRRKRVILPTIAVVAALGVGGVVWSSAANADLQGSERDRVGAAATSAVGGGTVVDAEASDDRGEAYEVEVRKDDGTTVDVTLDQQLDVVGRDLDDRTDADDSRDDSRDDDLRNDDLRDADDTANGVDADDRNDRNDPNDRNDRNDDTASGPDVDDRALSRSERTSAEQAALQAVDGGRVTSVEAGDDRGEAYEVQVLKGGTEWDVELDAGFEVLRKTADRN